MTPVCEGNFSLSSVGKAVLMVLLCGRSEIPGWEWDHYNETVPMSTYLVAFIISDLHPLDATVMNPSTSEDNLRSEVARMCRVWLGSLRIRVSHMMMVHTISHIYQLI
jgi:hypothetical protein